MATPSTNTNFAAQDQPEDLSVAVELKFLVPFLPRDGANLNVISDPPLEVLDFVEHAQAVKTEDESKIWKHAFSNIANTIQLVPNQFAFTTYELEDLKRQERSCWASHWVVKKSNSAEPAKNHKYRDDWIWVPVEVNSPKMSRNDPSTNQIIASVMDAIKTRHCVISNYSCEIHVHIGRMDGCAFSLPTLKRIAMLVWMIEPVLRSVKDPRSPNFQHVYTWSSAAREHSRLAMDLRCGKAAYVPQAQDLNGLPRILKRYLKDPSSKASQHLDAFRFIVAARSHVDLGRVMSGEGRPYRRLGYNFSAFGGEDERALTNPKTVECRFLEGTMDTGTVLGWIEIFGRMIDIALDGCREEDRFATLLLYAGERETPESDSMAFVRLMEELGISDKIYRHIQMMIQELHG
ncbi:hypothetical protein SCARD494_13640 [Seiridium cardinale]